MKKSNIIFTKMVNIKIGDTVQVIVSRVDLDDRKIDFQMLGAENQGGAVPAKGKPRSSGKRSIGTVRKRKPELKSSAVTDDKNDPYAKAKADKKQLMDEAKSAAKKKKKPSKRQKLNNAKKKATKKPAKKKK